MQIEKDTKIIYAYESAQDYSLDSVFLAGPSPRKETNYNWRSEAIKEIRKQGFDGNIFVPLPRDGRWATEYDKQIDWELEHLNKASVIIFWVPRDLETLPSFTTNVEFGMFLKSGKIILGFPKGAPKMKYLEYVAKKSNVGVSNTLKETISLGIELIGLLKR